jgi:hypothetical protein
LDQFFSLSPDPHGLQQLLRQFVVGEFFSANWTSSRRPCACPADSLRLPLFFHGTLEPFSGRLHGFEAYVIGERSVLLMRWRISASITTAGTSNTRAIIISISVICLPPNAAFTTQRSCRQCAAVLHQTTRPIRPRREEPGGRGAQGGTIAEVVQRSRPSGPQFHSPRVPAHYGLR